MKKIIISMAIASMLASSIGMAAYADNVTVSEETEISETVIEEQTGETSENTEENAYEEEADEISQNESGAGSADISDEEISDGVDEESTEAIKENEESENSNISASDSEIGTADGDEKDTLTEDSDSGKDEDKSGNGAQREERLENKAEKLEAINKLREMKLLAKATKIESLTYLKEIRTLFKDVDKADRQEVLSELAAIKEELQDYSVDTFVNGICIDYEKYDNVKPVIENGRTLAPIRAVAESLGAEVIWNEDTQGITITDNGIKIEMIIGNTAAYVNGTEVVLDAAPEIRNDRTLVPVRFIAESFNLNVDWDEASNSIIIE